MRHQAMLHTLGARVRIQRERMRLSRRELSASCKVSERFLAHLETGQGNISLARLADVAEALNTNLADLLVGLSVAKRHNVIALLGVRGAGKTSVGQRLAANRAIPFVEVDTLIEDAAGLKLAQLFELHGENYYRRLEGGVLERLLSSQRSAVIATGGSIVQHQNNFLLLKNSACTVWLRARAKDHWDRVIRQGDVRPMGQNPHAFAELKALLAARESLYASANVVIDTSTLCLDDVVAAVTQAVG